MNLITKSGFYNHLSHWDLKAERELLYFPEASSIIFRRSVSYGFGNLGPHCEFGCIGGGSSAAGSSGAMVAGSVLLFPRAHVA